MSDCPSSTPRRASVSRPPGGTHSSGGSVPAAGPNCSPHTHGTRSPQWSRWKCVIAIASTCGQSSRSRSRGRTPGPQSRRRRRPSLSTRYPDCAPPGFGQAGEQPTTVSFTFLYCPTVAGRIRVVIAKPGLDGHDRGAKIIARALRDAGMEVIYTGLHQTPEQIVETVIQEDADAVGLSILSGAHMTLVPRIVELLREQGVDDVLLTVGGTIPADDIPELKELGVAEVFTPGASTQDIIDFIQDAVRRRGAR